MDVDWQTLAAHPLHGTVARLVERLTQAPATDRAAVSARARIDAAPVGDRPRLLLEFVRTQVETVLGWPAGEHVNVKQGFFDLGMDSLQASELRNRLQTALDCKLPSTLMFRFPTTAALAQHLQGELLDVTTMSQAAAARPPEAALAPAPANDASAGVDQALQEELARLEQMLGK